MCQNTHAGLWEREFLCHSALLAPLFCRRSLSDVIKSYFTRSVIVYRLNKRCRSLQILLFRKKKLLFCLSLLLPWSLGCPVRTAQKQSQSIAPSMMQFIVEWAKSIPRAMGHLIKVHCAKRTQSRYTFHPIYTNAHAVNVALDCDQEEFVKS